MPALALCDKIQPGPVPAGTAGREAFQALAAGKLDQAERAFHDELIRNPKSHIALIGLAEVARRRGEPAESEKHLRAALRAAPNTPEVHRAWARFLMAQNRIAEAEGALNKSLQLFPTYEAHKDLGDLYLHRRQIEPALKAYAAALKLSPDSAEGHHAYAAALAATGNVAAAELEFRKAAALDAKNPAPLYSLALFHAEAKRWEPAVAIFSEILRSHPGFAAAYVGRGDVHAARGDDGKALADYASALKADARLAAVHMRVGLLHLRNRRIAEAERAFLETIRLNPNQADAYNNLAYLAAERKTNLDSALSWAKKAVALAPQSPQFLDTLGWVHRSRGELALASSTLEQASRLKSAGVDVFYHLGIVYTERGRKAEAARSFEKVVSLAPSSPEAADASRRLQALR